MAKAMTAASDVYPPEETGNNQAGRSAHRHEKMNVRAQIAKNLLFWGAISLSIYVLYALVAAS